MTGQAWPIDLKKDDIKNSVNIDTPLTVHTVCVEVHVKYCPASFMKFAYTFYYVFIIRLHASLGVGILSVRIG